MAFTLPQAIGLEEEEPPEDNDRYEEWLTARTNRAPPYMYIEASFPNIQTDHSLFHEGMWLQPIMDGIQCCLSGWCAKQCKDSSTT